MISVNDYRNGVHAGDAARKGQMNGWAETKELVIHSNDVDAMIIIKDSHDASSFGDQPQQIPSIMVLFHSL